MDDFNVLFPVPISITELRKIVEKEFVVKKDYFAMGTNIPTFIMERIEDPKKLGVAFNNIVEDVSKNDVFAIIREIEASDRIASKAEKYLSIKFFPVKRKGKSKLWLNAALFAATIFTVFLAAYFTLWTDPLYFPSFTSTMTGILFMVGYTLAILGIIGIHESGHLFAARSHNIKSSLPFFIPFVPPIGTMGAIIFQKSPPKNRNELFDLGLAGPLAGFLVAMVVGIIGFVISGVFLKMEYMNALYQVSLRLPAWLSGPLITDWVNVSSNMPDPLIFYLFSAIFIQNPVPVSQTALNLTVFNYSTMYVNVLHTITFAAWIGFFVTGLNLMPISQLDGGHVSRAFFGKKYYKYVSYIALIALFIINPIFALLVLFLSRFSLSLKLL
jgi:membrane-associated protease RseP (regulator of RpoE activity)